MASLGMASIVVPETPPDASMVDEVALIEAEHRTVASMNQDLVVMGLCEALEDAWYGEGNPLRALRDDLDALPLQHAYDASAWAERWTPGQDELLVFWLKKLIGRCHLAEYRRAQGRMTNVAF